MRIATRWAKGAPPERAALVRHACRTLLKAGHPDALALFGFGAAKLDAGPLELSSVRVAMGKTLEFGIALRSTAKRAQRLAIDYVLRFRRANGTTSTKVFKGGTVELGAGETVRFARSHAFREVTTRRHYPGSHALELRINGADTPAAAFELTVGTR